MHIYSLTEVIEETVKNRPYTSIAFMKKIITEIASGFLENLFFTCSKLVNNISVNKERIN